MIFYYRSKGIKRGQEGAALIAAVVFIVFIGFLGVTASFLFSSGTAATVDSLQSQRAFYIADSGVEYFRFYLKSYLENHGNADWSINPPPSPAPPVYPISFGDGEFIIEYPSTGQDTLTAKITGHSGAAIRIVFADFNKLVSGGGGGSITLNLTAWREG
ncbi:MAG: hypothetical protein AB1585_11155 [Thermodesulfobacteriota bacterium]